MAYAALFSETIANVVFGFDGDVREPQSGEVDDGSDWRSER